MKPTFDPILQRLRTQDQSAEEIIVSEETGNINVTMQPGKMYIYTNPIDSLSITLPSYSASVNEEFHFKYTAGTNGCALSVTVPSGTLQWPNGSVPTGTAEKTYEVSIQHNIGVFIEI